MNAREKVIKAEQVIREVLAQVRENIDCPFCGLTTEPGQMLCCDSMGEVSEVVLNHIEAQQRHEVVQRALDRFQKARLN